MLLLGCKFYKRMIVYVFFSLFLGFLFTIMFAFASGLSYTNGYFLNSLQNSLIMIVVSSIVFEVVRIVVIKKYAKLKDEIQKENTVIFDKPANLTINSKGFEGWLFLTADSLIFKSLKKKKPQNLVIPLKLITNINTISLLALEIHVNDAAYHFVLSRRNDLVDLINSKTSNINQ